MPRDGHGVFPHEPGRSQKGVGLQHKPSRETQNQKTTIPTFAHQLDTHNQQHTTQVRKVLDAMLAVDPRERINMRTVALFLMHPGLWARTTTGLRAAASGDAPELAGASTAASASPSPGDGGGKTSLDAKTLPESARILLSVVDDAANHGRIFTADGQVVPDDNPGAPSWLEVEMAKKGGAWWQNVPIPNMLERKGPRPRFMV